MTPAAPLVDPHWIDFCIVGLLVLSGIIGLMRGFTREILSLGCWAGAIGLSRSFYPLLQHKLSPYIKNPQLLDPIAMGLIFIIAMIMLTLLVRWISGFIHATLLAGLDRTLGLIFGVIRGSVVLWVIYAGLIFITTSRPKIFEKARLEPVLAWGAIHMLQWIPLDALTHFSAAHAQKLLKPPLIDPEHKNQEIFETLMHSVPNLGGDKPPESSTSQAPLPGALQDFLDSQERSEAP